MIFKQLILPITLVIMSSCSLFEKKTGQTSELTISNSDYLQHYAYIGKTYLNSQATKTIILNEDSKKYLKLMYSRLTSNNEFFFNQDDSFNLHVIENSTPFLFSLPGGEFFFSTGLIGKYLKSEELFVAALSAEVVKSKKNIYEKKRLIPLGFISTEKIVQLVRPGFEIKKSINEWAFVILKRAGFDGSAYLNWIQVQNRNSLEFAMYFGESININNEEQAFKSFLSKQGILGLEKKLTEANSSKEYYKLIKNISRK